MFLLDKMKYRDERNVGGEERDGPKAKELADGDVKDQLLRIVCCVSICLSATASSVSVFISQCVVLGEEEHTPTLSTLSSMRGLMILYQRYIHHISQRLRSKEPVRQKGCVKLAFGRKYFSRVARWVDGGDWVRRWTIWGISVSGFER